MSASKKSKGGLLPSTVAAVRQFNRFYTREIGVLHERLLKSPFSLTEVRVLYELAHRQEPTAVELCQELGLDAGYLSRILLGFEKRGLMRRTPCSDDGRRSLLALTTQGRAAFAPLDARSNEEVSLMLSRRSPGQRKRLVESMRAISEILGDAQERKSSYILRPHRPGDMGWVIHRHGVLYSQEHGYDEHFEALVAEIAANFIQNLDPKRERCWIAEREGEIVGSVFLVKKSKSKTVAKLRMLLVEPAARGLGIGKHLVNECVSFARKSGYKKIILWTQSDLHAARSIYKQAGFRLIDEKKHHSWGRDLVAEIWELKL